MNLLPFILTLLITGVALFLIVFIIVFIIVAIYRAVVKPVSDGGTKLKNSSRVAVKVGPFSGEVEDEAAKRRNPNKRSK